MERGKKFAARHPPLQNLFIETGAPCRRAALDSLQRVPSSARLFSVDTAGAQLFRGDARTGPRAMAARPRAVLCVTCMPILRRVLNRPGLQVGLQLGLEAITQDGNTTRKDGGRIDHAQQHLRRNHNIHVPGGWENGAKGVGGCGWRPFIDNSR